LETGSLDGNGVVAHGQKREGVVTGAAGLSSARLIGAEVDESDCRVWEHSAGGIRNRAEDVCIGQLTERRRCYKKEECQEEDRLPPRFVHWSVCQGKRSDWEQQAPNVGLCSRYQRKLLFSCFRGSVNVAKSLSFLYPSQKSIF
jgi:hypothetical protein